MQSARIKAVTNVNYLQVLTNFEIGRCIVEHEQQGASRAEYGKQILEALAERLTAEFGRGFSHTNIKLMRNFFLMYQERVPQIRQTVSDELPSVYDNVFQASTDSPFPFTLSWSHYVLLLGIRNENERRFYEIEAVQADWSLSELKRQCNSALFERLALSRDKQKVQQLACEGQILQKPSDMLKNPYVLEFLGLAENLGYSESDMESAIISKLQAFLLELGKGFLFEARQKRFTYDEDHFFVDLVFYNRLLRCYVLIDLKIGEITHQDLGQMQMYVNYFDRYIKLKDENPTVGIILCQKKRDALVEITLPRDANIFASEYQLYLPSKEDLRRQLMEWSGANTEADSEDLSTEPENAATDEA